MTQPGTLLSPQVSHSLYRWTRAIQCRKKKLLTWMPPAWLSKRSISLPTRWTLPVLSVFILVLVYHKDTYAKLQASRFAPFTWQCFLLHDHLVSIRQTPNYPCAIVVELIQWRQSSIPRLFRPGNPAQRFRRRLRRLLLRNHWVMSGGGFTFELKMTYVQPPHAHWFGRL